MPTVLPAAGADAIMCSMQGTSKGCAVQHTRCLVCCTAHEHSTAQNRTAQNSTALAPTSVWVTHKSPDIRVSRAGLLASHALHYLLPLPLPPPPRHGRHALWPGPA